MVETKSPNPNEKAAKIRRKPEHESVLSPTFAAARQVNSNIRQQPQASGTGLLQRQCSCGKHTIAGGVCEACQKKGESVSHASPDEMGATDLPAIQTFPDRPRRPDFSAIPARTIPASSKPIIQPALAVNEPGDPHEQEADRAAEVVMRMPASPLPPPLNGVGSFPNPTVNRLPTISRLQTGGGSRTFQVPSHVEARISQKQGRDQAFPDKTWDFMEPRFSMDFGAVRMHTVSGAVQLSRDALAQAFTHGSGSYFGQGKNLAQVVVHALPTTPPVIQRQPTSFAAIPQNERTALQISTAAVNVPQAVVDAVFATTNPTSYHHDESERTVQTVFATTIPETLRPGLTSVGAWLTNQTSALLLNTTINVALDLSSHGGESTIYRFTWFAHTEGDTTSNVMLIEEVGPATIIAEATAVPAGSFTIGGQTFNLRGRWNNNDFGTLQHALGFLSATELQAANGLTFNRRSGTSGTSEAGRYDPETGTVDLYDNSFPNVSTRIGTATRGELNILHEVAHAIDYRTLDRAFQMFTAGGQTAAGLRTFLRERSLSGSRYIQPGGGEYQWDYNLEAARDGDFRRAAQADHVTRDTSGRTLRTGETANLRGGATEYSDVNYEEMYAEAFVLYMTDRERLGATRPRTFAYFEARYH